MATKLVGKCGEYVIVLLDALCLYRTFSCIHVYTHYVYRYKKLINNSIIFILLCYFYSFFVVVVAVEPFLAFLEFNQIGYLVRVLSLLSPEDILDPKRAARPYSIHYEG